VTGPLTAAQAETLVNLVRDAIDARQAYAQALAKPYGRTDKERDAWDQRMTAALEASLAAEREAVTAIRALGGVS
jgi:hypothetical protein